MTTPKLQMPELIVGQAGKELTHNQALAVLDQLAQAVVVDKDLTAPPGSPANGAMYIVAAGATGAWAGQSGKLAYWLTTVAAWTFITPADGWSVWVADESKRYERVGGAWVLSSSALGLGTAAVANVTASSTDTTAGRVLKVGDFGLGAGAVAAPTDLDSIVVAGFTSCIVATTNGPGIAGSILTVVGTAVGRRSQIAFETAGFRIFYRSTNDSAVWSGWQQVANSATGLSITSENGSFGYGVGSGGTVTQATSKATGVTLNKPSGKITTAADALAANTVASFTLTNNKIGANDIPLVVIKSGATAGAYVVQVDAVAAGSCRISIRNMTAGSLSETLVLQFNIEKGAIA